MIVGSLPRTGLLARQGTEPPRDVTAEAIYPELRCLFEAHSLLLFRGQSIDEVKHRTLASLFGPLENLTDAGPDKTPPRPMVSNLAPDGTLAGEADLTTSPQPPRN